MATRGKTINFYKLDQGRDKFNLKTSLDEVFSKFKSHKYDDINELVIDDARYYISVIEKISWDDILQFEDDSENWYGYAINIAKVDPSQQVMYGNLSKVVDKRAEIIDLSDDDVDMTKVGPLFDSQFYIDPFYSIIASGRSIGGTNMWALKKFLSNLFGHKGLRLSVIPDEKTINDISNMSLIHKFSYTVAKSNDIQTQSDAARTEMGDIKLAKLLGGDEYTFEVRASNLNQKTLMEKLLQIFSKTGNEFDEVKSVNVDGVNNGVEVFYNLLKNILIYRGGMEYDETKGITIRDNFNFLSKAVASKKEFIKDQLVLVRGGDLIDSQVKEE